MLIFGTTGFCMFLWFQCVATKWILDNLSRWHLQDSYHPTQKSTGETTMLSEKHETRTWSWSLRAWFCLFRLLPYKLEFSWDFRKVGISRLYIKRKIKALMGVAQSLHQLFLSWASWACWARWARWGATAGVFWRPTAQLVLSSLASTSLAVLSDGVPNCWHVQ